MNTKNTAERLFENTIVVILATVMNVKNAFTVRHLFILFKTILKNKKFIK